MDFTLKTFIFYGFAFLTIASAFVVVTVRNIVHAACSLMVTLFGVAGHTCSHPIRCYDDKRTLGDAHSY